MKCWVLLSSYKGCRYLPEQLSSIADQSHRPLALLLRDDGSPDDTLNTAQTQLEQSGLEYQLIKGENQGATGSFFSLIQATPEDADFIAFADQDDYWQSDKINKAISVLQSIEGPALYFSRLQLADAELNPLALSPEYPQRDFNHVLFENFATGCTMVVNRAGLNLLQHCLPPATHLAHDWWVALCLTAFGTVVYDPEPAILYRQHGNNVVGQAEEGLELIKQKAGHLTKKAHFYRAWDQANQFLKIYRGQLNPEQLELVQQLVESKSSFFARACFALSGKIKRNSWLDQMVVRLLILLNRY